MGVFSLRQFAVATYWSGGSVILWTLFVQVVAPIPKTTGWLFAVCPDVAELLAVVALRKSALGSICLRLNSNVVEAWQTEDSLQLCSYRQGYEEEGRVCYFDFSGGD
jgi:hypothetical protein